ncbi:MAG: hypothetical protein FWF50_06450, partial [Defluviitaleaceae bacterium]|nr:hypothetical protein [Defluviitaleaceae bacterium]
FIEQTTPQIVMLDYSQREVFRAGLYPPIGSDSYHDDAWLTTFHNNENINEITYMRIDRNVRFFIEMFESIERYDLFEYVLERGFYCEERLYFFERVRDIINFTNYSVDNIMRASIDFKTGDVRISVIEDLPNSRTGSIVNDYRFTNIRPVAGQTWNWVGLHNGRLHQGILQLTHFYDFYGSQLPPLQARFRAMYRGMATPLPTSPRLLPNIYEVEYAEYPKQ